MTYALKIILFIFRDFVRFVCFSESHWIIFSSYCRRLIAFTKNRTDYAWQGYILAVMMFMVAFNQSFVLHQYFHKCFVSGMHVRTTIIAMVYKKVRK